MAKDAATTDALTELPERAARGAEEYETVAKDETLPRAMSASERWQRAADLLCAHRDVVDERPAQGLPPRALVTRGWASALAALDDTTLDALEIAGLEAPWPVDTPPSLSALVEEARAICDLPSFRSPAMVARAGPIPRVRETPRKRAQIEAFVDVVASISTEAARVLDVGAGHGHLTRALAERLPPATPGRAVIGLERDPKLASRARSLSNGSATSFEVTDVIEDGLAARSDDCIVGLHACGELGDAMVSAAAQTGASLALVGCCPQKRSTPARRALVRERGDALDLGTRVLGLANLTARDQGVEASRRENLAARERRIALHRLLEDEVGPLRFGAEMDGLNRRATHEALPTLVQRAFARRGRSAPTAAAIDRAAAWSATQHALVRRLSLPRSMLARVIEVFVLVDRAVYLERHGKAVTTGALFPTSVSARNLALLAR